MSDSWQPQHDKILVLWKSKAFVNLWLQNRSTYYYLYVYNFLSYLIIIISSVSSATLFSDPNLFGGKRCINYIVGSLSIFSAICISILRQMKPAELHNIHAITTKKYHNIIRTIDACLSLPVRIRPPSIAFIEKIGRELENIESSQNEAPRHIIRRFEKAYGPIDRLLYGEDVLQLLQMEYKTKKMFNKLEKFKSGNGDNNVTPSSEEIAPPSSPPPFVNYLISNSRPSLEISLN
jgi:hypothetical protein